MWNNYEKIRLLGEGGMGEVWLVSHKSARTLFAAKFLKPELTRPKDYIRFQRELRALSSIDHPNIIKVVDVSEDKSKPGYVMEYCPDGSLEDQFQSADLDARKLLSSLCNAVKCIHDNHLIHRDIKPQNILISPGGQLRLSDFGLVIDDNSKRTVVTTSNWVSCGFAPPEQYRDMSSVTKKADIFAIGAVYYYLRTGRTIDVFSDLSGQITDFEGFDRYLMMHSLAFKEDERFMSIDEMIAILDPLHEEHRLFEYLNLNTTDRRNLIDNKLHEVEPVIDNMDIAQNLMHWFDQLLPFEVDAELKQFLAEKIKELDDEWASAFSWHFRDGGNDV